jgi:peroxiredoxin
MAIRWKWLGGLVGALLSVLIFVTTFTAKPAPLFNVKDIYGKNIALAQLKGSPVLINFWATSCPSCVRDMPNWISLYQAYQAKGVKVIAVAMSYDDLEYVKTFAAARQLPFSVVYDADGELAKSFGDIRLTPTTAWIDRSGQWVETSLGDISLHRLKSWLDKQYL